MEYGCIGEHLGHSFSQEIHKKIGDYNYILQEISNENLANFMESRQFKGINVTIPYKVDVIPFLDCIDKKAAHIGAVNTIVNEKGKLSGFNTDFDGMRALILRLGVDIKDKKALILGTGGSSKTAEAVFTSLGAGSISKVSRSKKAGAITYEEACENYKDTQIIVNTTPCGMFPNTENSPIGLDSFPKLQGLVDIIYNPLRSKLVLSAQKLGIPAEGGLYMLVAQAVYASEHFFNVSYPAALIHRVYSEIISEKENIVLIGMPGSGKSTIGKVAAKKLHKEWIDTDKLIAETYGAPAGEIINKAGIEKFREIESNIIKSIHTKNNCIISTGGGAVLDEENVTHLKMNGKVFLIDRPVEMIHPTSDRPLSSDKNQLLKLHNERKAIYHNSCDYKINNQGSIDDAVSSIISYCQGERI